MAIIRVREGAGGTKYQVTIHVANRKTITRTFRRLTDAKAWAQREEKKLRDSGVPTVPEPH